jgi:hypothetical protein
VQQLSWTDDMMLRAEGPATSYNGTLSISATADRDSLPDPATYAECMEQAFQELLAVAR